MSQAQFKIRSPDGLTLRERVHEFIRENEPVTITDLELRFPEQATSSLYRALRKLEERATIRKLTDVKPHQFVTFAYANIAQESKLAISSKLFDLFTKQPERGPRLADLITDGSMFQEWYRDTLANTSSYAILNALLADSNQARKEKAIVQLERAVRSYEALLNLMKLLKTGVRTGFLKPDEITLYLPELEELLDRYDPI